MAKIHVLKTWPDQWEAVACGDKTFEFRKDDRGYQVGDYLILRKYDPQMGYQDRGDGKPMDLTRVVSSILDDGDFGLTAGHVIMSLQSTPQDAGSTMEPTDGY